jgi:List-Bact-rpt repeat protein/Big-like domain-containing protein
MNGKWFSIAALVITAIWLLSVSSCGDDQQLVSISVTPSTETFGASNIPVIENAGATVQLRALGTYVHPPVTKDITSQVTWASNTPGMVTVNSAGLITATGLACGGTLISATVQTNADASGLSASGAIVTGYMTANVVCFVSSSGGGGTGGEPTLTLDFAGGGAGFVTSTPSGLSCFSTDVSCVTSFPTGTPVTLTATPSPPSVFGGWSVSGCSGTSCTFPLEADTIVTATFN